MNILHGLDVWQIGGIQELVRTLGLHSHHQHFTTGYRGTMTPYLEEAGVFNFEGAPPMDVHFDIYVGHTVGGWSYESTFAEMRRRGAKCVECMHSNAVSLTPRESADGFIALNHIARQMNTYMPRAQTIYVPVDVKAMSEWVGNHAAIGRLSRLAEEKKPWQFAQLADEFPRETFLLAGDGPERERITARPNMLAMGWVRNFPGFYAGLKLFVFPTRDECCCQSVALAQAARVPVICEDLEALRETTGGFATFCKTHDEFIYAMKVFLADPRAPLWADLVDGGYEWVRRYFDLPVTVGAWDAYLESL